MSICQDRRRMYVDMSRQPIMYASHHTIMRHVFMSSEYYESCMHLMRGLIYQPHERPHLSSRVYQAARTQPTSAFHYLATYTHSLPIYHNLNAYEYVRIYDKNRGLSAQSYNVSPHKVATFLLQIQETSCQHNLECSWCCNRQSSLFSIVNIYSAA